MLFQAVIPLTAGAVGVLLLVLLSLDPNRQSTWAGVVQPLVTLCITAIPVSLLISLVLKIRRTQEDRRGEE